MVARDVQETAYILKEFSASDPVWRAVPLKYPQWRWIMRRVQAIRDYPYSEIRDNLIADGVQPLDILRLKLSFCGVLQFNSKSDLWLRVNMYQDVPLPPQLQRRLSGGA
ncbi:MAG: hypothetical protein HRT36_08105 [Alphaproteobacteria bacterium]|nr:hypothetical protein [Alphaproteobacteria bacterium]